MGLSKRWKNPDYTAQGLRPDQSHQGFNMNTRASKVSKLMNQLQLSNEAWHSEITQFRRPMHMDRESVDVLLCNCELA